MMKNKLSYAWLIAGFALTLGACKKDDDAPVIPPSDGTTLTLNGGAGGANAENTVFVDFSKDEQDSVKRVAWDLGFYCSSTDFRVKINNTTAATAKAINKTDLTLVTTSDTVGFSASLALGQGAGTMDIIDDVDGDITKTVIAAISATDSDNKVYILKLSNGMVSPAKDWYKIRILRNGTGYKLQYAKLSETTVKTIDIAKDASYNFKYVSLDKGAAVSVEPAKADWDIEWTLTTYKASATIPYTFSDYVYINYLGGVTAAEVLTSTVTYDNYVEANITTTTFSNSKVVIGGNWRATTGTIGVKTDRFYVVKDPAGNVYKLKFVSFHANDGGVRGMPVIEYKLVKKA
ncbi:MAG: HmuY family protein [Chitinophagaceae bacterium]